MSLNLTITVSVIIALCAIISPIIVAIINNRHNLKLKKLEIAKSNKISAYENYLSSLENYLSTGSVRDQKVYNKSLGSALLFVPNSARKLIFEIDEKIKTNSIKDITKKIDTLCKLLHSDIEI